VPIVQIIIGVLIAVIPYGALGFEFDLEPELFFVLFLSPLVFCSTMAADKKTMQSLIKPIIMAAVALVFVTTVAAGYFTHLLAPVIPLAAAFALAGALGTIDIVAVEAVAQRISLPRRIWSILSGEALISDAACIICFQFAVAAVATGSFNAFEASLRLIVLAAGGLLVGLVCTVLKYMLVRWLHSMEMHTVTLHISISLMTPFIVYMIAEGFSTSGILAVFISGIIHSLYRDKFNPEVVKLDRAQENVWSVVTFSLEGLVFVMLGTQLPRILREYTVEDHDIHGLHVALYIVLIYAALSLVRFIWWAGTVRRKTYDNDPENPIGMIKSGIIFSVAGARGAVSMACVLSIPLVLPDGSAFPQRDLIILIAGGVIIVSLLMTNFVLPLLAKQKAAYSLNDTEEAARLEILQTVVHRLKEAATPENFAATQIVTRNYHSRMNHHPLEGEKLRGMRKLRQTILLWEKEAVLHMAEMGQISKASAEHYIEEADRLVSENDKKMNPFGLFIWTVRHFIESLTWKEPKTLSRGIDLLELKMINERIMRERLNKLGISEDDPAYAIIAAEHEQVVSTRIGKGDGSGQTDSNAVLFEVAAYGLYTERVLIQQMLEDKRLSWKTAKEMQGNITLLEAQILWND
jgi:CPA1 family monovalent cation:H+ antiporter